jgi:hypothetical protein
MIFVRKKYNVKITAVQMAIVKMEFVYVLMVFMGITANMIMINLNSVMLKIAISVKIK